MTSSRGRGGDLDVAGGAPPGCFLEPAPRFPKPAYVGLIAVAFFFLFYGGSSRASAVAAGLNEKRPEKKRAKILARARLFSILKTMELGDHAGLRGRN